jgi:tetratricopeptide (TPR) repeat protein
VLHGLGLLNEALKEYNVALKLQPNSTLVYFNLGNIYLEKGYMEDAQQLLTSMQMYVRVISLEPLYRGAFNNLGNALKEADFFDHAIRCDSPSTPQNLSR